MTPWSEAEREIIRTHYPENGTRRIRELLPHRPLAGIRTMAASMNLVCSPQRRNKMAKTWSPAEDALITKYYPRLRIRKDPMTREKLAALIGVTSGQVEYRAMQLGMLRTRKKDPDWSEEEEELLLQHAHKSVDAIMRIFRAHGYRRTRAAICVRRKRLGYQVAGNGVAYSATELARLLGTSSRSITQWISRGWLKARPRTAAVDPNTGGVGDRWLIYPQDVKKFIFEFRNHFRLADVDQHWFLSLVE